jgi:hypothetical protein
MPTPHDLQQTLAAIQRRWGDTSILPARRLAAPARLPTGQPDLDALTGGGLPRGRITQFSGQPTSGMTTLAWWAAAAAQGEDTLAAYLDVNASFDPEYAAQCGLDVERLLLIRPASAAIALEMLFDVVASGIPGLVICNALTDCTGAEMAALERTLNRLHAALARSRCVLLLLTGAGAPPLLQVTLHLRVERLGWQYSGHDVCGYALRASLPERGTAVTLDVTLAGDV